MCLTPPSQPVPHTYSTAPARKIKEKKDMNSAYSSQNHDDTCSRNTRSPSAGGVSTTEGAHNLQFPEPSPYETRAYISSRTPSSQGLASPSYLGPNLTETPSYLSPPLSQNQHPFPPLSDGSVASRNQWYGEAQPRTPGTSLVRIDSPDHRLGSSVPSPALSSVETNSTMR
jgi:hypothetical protein